MHIPGSNDSRLFIQVINLARRPDRLAQISTELEQAGLNFETLIAVDGQLEQSQSEFLSKGEIACWKSHINAMRKAVDKNAEFSLIFEDDATPGAGVNEKLLFEIKDLMERNHLDLLQIGYIENFYSPSLRHGPLEFLIALLRNRGTKDSSGFRFVLGDLRAGAHAYIVNARLAEAISRSVPEPPLIPWDGYLESLARGQVGRGDIRMARLVKSLVSQASRVPESLKVDSDIAT
jgi:GR25 family glycosyltransferase involved in LPS biosynthesis